MDKIRNIIASACLKHSDSGLASFDREARVILQALSENGYTIVKQLKPVDVNTKWECENCGWVGTHSETADKTPVVGDLYLLVCPKCGSK